MGGITKSRPDLQQRRPAAYRLKCLTANLPALAFYQKLGWREIGRGTSDDGTYLLLALPAPAEESAAS